jgi:arsenate reductase
MRGKARALVRQCQVVSPADARDAHQITMSLIVYGIPACSTVKKARTFLDEQGQAYAFHDYKKQGVPEKQLDAWIKAVGWEPLVNRQGTTWRQFDDATKAAVVDAASARALMLANASLIKRPVIEHEGKVLSVGFDDKKAQAVLDALA